MPYDFKKEQRTLYHPGKRPTLIDVPAMNYIAVRGQGDPNQPDSEYKHSIQELYSVAYTIKMSKKGTHQIPGYFDFVVPPLEGFWWQEGIQTIDFTRKDRFHFVSCIRMPGFVDQDTFDWAVKTASVKKNLDLSNVEFLTIDEGRCAQIMHTGLYDDEPATIAKLTQFVAKNDLQPDYSATRRHHEIYLSDPRRTKPENRKTVIRIPVK